MKAIHDYFRELSVRVSSVVGIKGRHYKLHESVTTDIKGDPTTPFHGQVFEATGVVKERAGSEYYQIIRRYNIYGQAQADYILANNLVETWEPLTPLPGMPSVLDVPEKRDPSLTGKHFTVGGDSSWLGTGFYKDTKAGKHIQLVDSHNKKYYIPETDID